MQCTNGMDAKSKNCKHGFNHLTRNDKQLSFQALCKRSVVTFVGYALLRVGGTPLRKTPVGLTADLFTNPSF